MPPLSMSITVQCEEWNSGGEVHEPTIESIEDRPQKSFLILMLHSCSQCADLFAIHAMVSRASSSKLQVSLCRIDVVLFSEDSGRKRMNAFRGVHLISLIREGTGVSWESFEFLSRVKGFYFTLIV